MKKVFALILAVLLLVPVLGGCNAPAEETTATTNNSGFRQPKEGEDKITRVLILGNSHSNDVFYQLGRVFDAQGYDNEIYLGFLYYSGCSIDEHVEFTNTNAAVYELCLPKSGLWE